MSIRRLFLAAILLAACTALAVLILLDPIARIAAERGGSRVLGVETRLEEVDIGLLSGRVALSRLEVANPKGFREDRFLGVERTEVQVAPASLLQRDVVVPLVSITGVEVFLEQRGTGSNYGAILESIDASTGAGETTATQGSQEVDLVVEELLIREISGRVEFTAFGGRVASAKLSVPDIRMRNLRSSSTSGRLMGQLAAIATTAILKGVLSRGAGLPRGIAGDLERRLTGLGSYRLGLASLLESPEKAITEPVVRASEAAGETVEKAGELLKGVGGLLRGPSEEDR